MTWRVDDPATAATAADPDLSAEADLQPWYLPESYFEELPGVMCATDLLVAWKPDSAVTPLAPGRGPEAAWDAYFAGTAAAAAPAVSAPAVTADASSVESWDPGAAAAAVECLFRFLHALERQDVTEAMLCVAPDFHTLDGDLEQDRNALRLWLERRVDEWRGPELRLALTEIPEPVPHPMGTLIHMTLEVDHHNPFRERAETEVLGFVMLLGAEPRGETLIRSLARVS